MLEKTINISLSFKPEKKLTKDNVFRDATNARKESFGNIGCKDPEYIHTYNIKAV